MFVSRGAGSCRRDEAGRRAHLRITREALKPRRFRWRIPSGRRQGCVLRLRTPVDFVRQPCPEHQAARLETRRAFGCLSTTCGVIWGTPQERFSKDEQKFNCRLQVILSDSDPRKSGSADRCVFRTRSGAASMRAMPPPGRTGISHQLFGARPRTWRKRNTPHLHDMQVIGVS